MRYSMILIAVAFVIGTVYLIIARLRFFIIEYVIYKSRKSAIEALVTIWLKYKYTISCSCNSALYRIRVVLSSYCHL